MGGVGDAPTGGGGSRVGGGAKFGQGDGGGFLRLAVVVTEDEGFEGGGLLPGGDGEGDFALHALVGVAGVMDAGCAVEDGVIALLVGIRISGFRQSGFDLQAASGSGAGEGHQQRHGVASAGQFAGGGGCVVGGEADGAGCYGGD